MLVGLLGTSVTVGVESVDTGNTGAADGLPNMDSDPLEDCCGKNDELGFVNGFEIVVGGTGDAFVELPLANGFEAVDGGRGDELDLANGFEFEVVVGRTGDALAKGLNGVFDACVLPNTDTG